MDIICESKSGSSAATIAEITSDPDSIKIGCGCAF
ncbi:hypothetical protein C357_00174 [Citreicella sp. 357]|nr:hypothetical protein C357_00174 [Citreicella sp. 357]